MLTLSKVCAMLVKNMKKKTLTILSFVFVSIISVASLGLNIYFLATRPQKASGIFYACKSSVVEVKALTEEVGTSYGSAVIISNQGIIATNAHVITYKQLGQTYTFDKIDVRFADEENYREATIIKYDLNLDIAVLKIYTIKFLGIIHK